MFEIRICLTRTQHIAVEAILEELGAVSISLHNAAHDVVFVETVDATPLWKQITLNALFNEDIELSPLQNTLEKALGCAIEISKRVLAQQDWQHAWRQGLRPMQFGERLWVCPSYCTSPDPFAINIRLDPGLAFGTGTHATTALCLEWLAQHSPVNKMVVDFGCGSGILGITAYHLGAKSVIAIDHDPQALQATRINADSNHVPPNLFNIVSTSNLNDVTCDLLMANILLQPLIKLTKIFTRMTLSTSKIILSGILEHQLEGLTQAYQPYFHIDQVYSKKEWLLVEASRR